MLKVCIHKQLLDYSLVILLLVSIMTSLLVSTLFGQSFKAMHQWVLLEIDQVFQFLNCWVVAHLMPTKFMPRIHGVSNGAL